MLDHLFSRLFVPWNIRSHDGTFILGTICSLELSFPRTNKPCRPFPPWTIGSLDRLFPGTFVQVPWTFLASDHSFICQQSMYLVHLQRRNSITKQKRRPMTAMVHSCNTQRVDQRYNASSLNRSVAVNAVYLTTVSVHCNHQFMYTINFLLLWSI